MGGMRSFPTQMRSARHLVQALQAVGLREVESDARGLELMSWRGKPLGESAEVVVRRRSIGATADDLGFQRALGGAFEARLSDIHLSRFDRRWFAELQKRYDALLEADPVAEPAPEASAIPRTAQIPAATPLRAHETVEEPGMAVEREASVEPVEPVVPAPGFESLPADLFARLPEVTRRELQAISGVQPREFDVQKEVARLLAALPTSAKPQQWGLIAVVWVFVAVVAILAGSSPAFWVIASIAGAMIGQKKGRKMIDADVTRAMLAFTDRFRDPAHRQEALKRLRRSLEALPKDKQMLVRRLLNRLGG